MADQPFADAAPDLTPPTLPTGPVRPQAVGVHKVLLIGIVLLVTVGVVGFILFGALATRRAVHRPVSGVAEATPRPATAGDPLRGLQGDYARLLTKPPIPPPVGPLSPPPPSEPAAAPQAVQRTAPAKAGERERGVLVVEGKRQRDAQAPPVTARYSGTEQAGSSEGGPQQQTDSRPQTAQEAFLQQSAALQPVVLQDRLHTPESPFMVLAGSIIPASLITGINSDLPGPIVAQVRQTVRDSVTGQYILVPQGSRLIGSYDSAIVFGQDRVLLAWQRLLLPNGESLQLEAAPGLDVAGYAGLADKVNPHFWKLLRAVLMSSVLSMGSQIPFGNTKGYVATLPQQFAQEFANNAQQAGQAIVNQQLQQKPTIEIRPGMSVLVFVHRDIVLKPWKAQ